MVDVHVIRHITLWQLCGLDDNGQLLGAVTHFDHIALFHAVGRNVDLFAIHFDVAVIHELTRSEHSWDELRTVHNRVQTTFEQTDQVFTCIALYTLGFCIDAAELLFCQVAVVALKLLLGAQLQTKVRQLALAALAVLAGAIFTTVYRGLWAAPDVFAHTAVNFILGRRAFCHG